MALNTQLGTAAQNAAANAIAALANSGSIVFYAGTQPAANGSAGTVLATATLGSTAFGSASSGVCTANAISNFTVTGTGTQTCQWFRVFESNGTTIVYDGSVGTSSADCVVSTTSFTNGVTISISSLTLTVDANVSGI